MSDAENWLERFGNSHERLGNPIIYWLAVPPLVLGMVGILWSMPVPEQFYQISPLLNWGSAFLMVVAIYYFIISLSLAIGLLPMLVGLAGSQLWLLNSPLAPLPISAGLLAAGLAGVVLSRGGNLRAIFEDLQLIMIGPVWLLAVVYRRLDIPI